MKPMTTPSVMSGGHAFSMVPRAQIERSQFDRSHGLKTTFDEGWLVPIYVDEALPGDTFRLNMAGFARLATPLKPLMDNVYIDTFFFAVPYRLVWANFVKFMGEQEPSTFTVYNVPTITSPAGGYLEQSLYDYLGLPTKVAGLVHSALYCRAYFLIYNQWFRDENLIGSWGVPTGDGPDAPANYFLLRRGKRHDYFTSCLPWPQKGNPISIPLGSTAPVIPSGTHETPTFWDGTAGVSAGHLQNDATGHAVFELGLSLATNAGWNDPKLMADLSSATAATINSMRQAFQIQKMLERDARGGTRYTELVRSHFGVTSPDARLQRAEYLGGGSSPIVIAPIAQASDLQRTDAGAAKPNSTPQGNLSAVGTAAFRGHGFVKSFTEHCMLLGFASVRSDLTYQQGMDRMWSRSTKYDFYWPSLAHLGEQAVYNKEIYADGSGADAGVFGYQERYAEYRYKPSHITGKFRSNATGTLEIWHLSQKFTALPTLATAFIEEPTGSAGPLYRTLAVPTEPHVLADFWFDLKCARPMPVFSVPGLIDHF